MRSFEDWLDQADRRRAEALHRELFERVVAAGSVRPGPSAAGVILVCLSALTLCGAVACAVFGAFFAIRWPNALWMLLGLVMLAVAFEIRPRVPNWHRKLDVVGRDEAPTLRRVVDEVADAVGAPRPAVVGVSDVFNATCGRSGWRFAPALNLGLPLWGCLDARMRVAVLAHELGHLVNRDPRRGALTQPAITTCITLASVLDPELMLNQSRGWIDQAMTLLVTPVLWPASRLARLAAVGLNRLAARESIAAEYYADGRAVATAGTDGMVHLLTVLLDPAAELAVQRQIRKSPDAADWQAACAAAIDRDQAANEQRALSKCSIFDSHPPAALRRRAVQAWPPAAGRYVLDPATSQAIDRELARRYQRLTRIS